MCGIVGAYHFSEHNFSADVVKYIESTSLLVHRGPDHTGHVARYPFFLGHTRLSIIDNSANANQPFLDATGNYGLVYNGEIFNYKHLKEILVAKGYSFKSQSDTEVLLYWLIEFGLEGIHQINGFFAFAFADFRACRLVIMRDRFGVKPVYFIQNPTHFLFASELRSLQYLHKNLKLNPSALALYLKLSYIPAPQSIYNHVYKLEPGTYLQIDRNNFVKNKYYPPDVPPDTPPLNTHTSKHLISLLRKSIQLRLTADVPVGTFLSGGIDSSIITTIARSENYNLQTFSLGYNDNSYLDESDKALQIANFLKTNHHAFLIDTDEIADNFFRMTNHIDEPFGDSSALAVYILSSKTIAHSKVVLSGDGADELFGGYNKHKAEALIQQFRTIIRLLAPVQLFGQESRYDKIGNTLRKLHKIYAGTTLDVKSRYWNWCGFFSESDIEKLLQTNLQHHEEYQKTKQFYTKDLKYKDLNSILEADFKLVLPNDMLYKIDFMAMAHGLEIREPFLDPRIVTFSKQLNAQKKYSPFFRKKILYEVARDLLPEKYISSVKKGFEIPVEFLLRNHLHFLVEKYILDESYISAQGIFHYDFLDTLYKSFCLRKDGNAAGKLWTILIFQIWHNSQFKNIL